MTTESDVGWPSRYRNLIVAGVLVVAVIALALIAGKHAGSSRTALQVGFGASVQPPSGRPLTFTNGWVVSSGKERVAVYAGSQARHPRNGLLVTVIHVAGQRRRDVAKLVIATGALTLLRPSHFDTIQAAAQATLRFVTANGGTGTLDLSTQRVALNR